MLSGILALEANALHQRVVKPDSALYGAVIHAGAAIPALLRIDDDGRFALLGVGYENELL